MEHPLAEALYELLVWATGPNRRGNPYMHQPVENALIALNKWMGVEGVWRNAKENYKNEYFRTVHVDIAVAEDDLANHSICLVPSELIKFGELLENVVQEDYYYTMVKAALQLYLMR